MQVVTLESRGIMLGVTLRLQRRLNQILQSYPMLVRRKDVHECYPQVSKSIHGVGLTHHSVSMDLPPPPLNMLIWGCCLALLGSTN